MKILPTLRQLRYLVALAEHRHFGRAAETCLATQSTLSAGLQELENLLGVVLVERTKRKVMLTPLGEEVVARAREVLHGAEDIADLAAGAAEPLSGPLRLGVIPTIAPYLLPRVLPRLRTDHPGLRLYLREDLTARLLDRLGAGDLDVVLIALPYHASDIETLEIAEDPFVLACPPGHPLATKANLRSADLVGADLLLLEEGHCLRDHALAACSWTSPTGTSESLSTYAANHGGGFAATSLNTLVQMVGSGLGVSLLPAMAVDSGMVKADEVCVRPLASDHAFRDIVVIWRAGSSRAAEARLLAEKLKE